MRSKLYFQLFQLFLGVRLDWYNKAEHDTPKTLDYWGTVCLYSN
jgi:hypothetical protein